KMRPAPIPGTLRFKKNREPARQQDQFCFEVTRYCRVVTITARLLFQANRVVRVRITQCNLQEENCAKSGHARLAKTQLRAKRAAVLKRRSLASRSCSRP